MEDTLLCAIGLSWHWDFEGLNTTPRRYRQMLARLFSTQDFIEFDTTEPNIMMEPTNVLLVRIGKRVAPRQVEKFRRVIQRSPALCM
ncbi:hypothetical protein [Ktedonospora formicarum]|uniref:Uncharacterized protein n=1 Tax=Ktedonospora formicarum TaxID=2778364 RepID=A0A8J3MU02_9CHLR|nr:hypothetical protein [Ktedonospora formicarum]GHO48747.1 hypothetical protein KSX_69100 [Ktedonospora formicarum]